MRVQTIKIILILALVFILAPPVVAAPPTMVAHWKRVGPPVVVSVYDQTANKLWEKALHKSVAEWNAGIKGIQFTFGSGPADCEKGQGPYTVVVCIRKNASPNHVGEANLYWSEDGHFTHVTIWMAPRSRPNRNNLACHELGHALGLGHRGANENSCMTNGRYKRPEHPDKKDFNTVNLQYSHVH